MIYMIVNIPFKFKQKKSLLVRLYCCLWCAGVFNTRPRSRDNHLLKDNLAKSHL